ncbi:MAG: PEP-CTERM sorting domain-containing protein [Methylophilus sp.]
MKKYLFYVLMCFTLISKAHAGVLFESATGPFDPAGCCGGSGISNSQFIGSVFTVNETINVDGIGGHFNNIPSSPSFAAMVGLGGSIFGAIVNLDGSGLPSGDLTNLGGVIASTVFTPNSGVDTLTSLNATLSAGTYGLIFGSGQFGATGSTTLTLIQPGEVITSDGDAISINTSSFPSWSFFNEGLNRNRIFLSGVVVTSVPEPDTYLMLILGLVFISIFMKRKMQS